MARRFEFREGKSDKFWEIEQRGASTVVRFGRRGTAGQSRTKDHADEVAARAAVETLIREKTREGYREVPSTELGTQADGGAAQQGPETITYNVELILLSGKSKKIGPVRIGQELRVPEYRRWSFDVPSAVSFEQLSAIVEDVNRRAPPEVSVAGSALDDARLPALRPLRNLVEITSVLCPLTDAGLEEISRHETLEELGIMDASGTSDHGLAALSKLVHLRHLQIVVPGMYSDAGIHHLARLERLEELEMVSLTNVSDRGLEALLRLPRLEYCDFKGQNFTKAALAALKKKCAENKRRALAGKRGPSPAAREGELAPAVLQQIERLGGRFEKASRHPPEASSLPAPLRGFIFDVDWPRGITFANDENCSPWVFGVEFGNPTHWKADFDACRSCRGRRFVCLGIADGGNYFLVTPADQESPDDPAVHVLDHEEIEAEDALEGPVLLSKLLATLQREGDHGEEGVERDG